MNERKAIETTAELAAWYDSKYTEMGDGWHTPVSELNQHLEDLGVTVDSTKRLLDVGCGAGHFLVEAQKRVQSVGVEISQVGLSHCRRRGVQAFSYDIGANDGVNDGVNDVKLEGESFDYIVSLGSLEHIVNLNAALGTIRRALKGGGRFYFFCPNALWAHFDQPNERNMTDAEWMRLFAAQGLYVHTLRRWNNNTAFVGASAEPNRVVTLPPHGDKLNLGSGQRRFDAGQGWINVDCVARPPQQIPDLVCDVGVEPLPYADNTMKFVVLHQVYEHFGLGEGHGVLREAHRVLQPGGSLILTVPCVRALAQRRMMGQIDDYIFAVNMMGAYQGEDGDRHKWCFWDLDALTDDVKRAGVAWAQLKRFNHRPIPGADIAQDWWIMGLEAVK